MRVNFIKIELSEDEYRYVNNALMIVQEIRKKTSGSITLAKNTWNDEELSIIELFLIDLEEECTIE